MVQVGTPNVTLLVALDTGSDVFWVPCDCQACAPTSAASYGLNVLYFQLFPFKLTGINLIVLICSLLSTIMFYWIGYEIHLDYGF